MPVKSPTSITIREEPAPIEKIWFTISGSCFERKILMTGQEKEDGYGAEIAEKAKHLLAHEGKRRGKRIRIACPPGEAICITIRRSTPFVRPKRARSGCGPTLRPALAPVKRAPDGDPHAKEAIFARPATFPAYSC